MSRLTIALAALSLVLSACGAAESSAIEQPAPAIEPPPPACKSANTAPGCTPATAAWAVTCDAPIPAPAIWCTLPEAGDGKIWCC